MIRFGQALRSNHRLRHIFVVMSDPSKTGGQILLVNFTSYEEDLHKGEAIFGPADYSMLICLINKRFGKKRPKKSHIEWRSL